MSTQRGIQGRVDPEAGVTGAVDERVAARSPELGGLAVVQAAEDGAVDAQAVGERQLARSAGTDHLDQGLTATRALEEVLDPRRDRFTVGPQQDPESPTEILGRIHRRCRLGLSGLAHADRVTLGVVPETSSALRLTSGERPIRRLP